MWLAAQRILGAPYSATGGKYPQATVTLPARGVDRDGGRPAACHIRVRNVRERRAELREGVQRSARPYGDPRVRPTLSAWKILSLEPGGRTTRTLDPRERNVDIRVRACEEPLDTGAPGAFAGHPFESWERLESLHVTRNGRGHLSVDRRSIRVGARRGSNPGQYDERNSGDDKRGKAGGQNSIDRQALFHVALTWLCVWSRTANDVAGT